MQAEKLPLSTIHYLLFNLNTLHAQWLLSCKPSPVWLATLQLEYNTHAFCLCLKDLWSLSSHFQNYLGWVPYFPRPFSEVVSCICNTVWLFCHIFGSLDLLDYFFKWEYIKIHSLWCIVVSFHKYIVSYIHHYRIIKNSSTALVNGYWNMVVNDIWIVLDT